MLKKTICLNKIILRENILEDLFTYVKSINSITFILSHHVPSIGILLQTPHCSFLRHLGLSLKSLVSMSCLDSNCWRQGVSSLHCHKCDQYSANNTNLWKGANILVYIWRNLTSYRILDLDVIFYIKVTHRPTFGPFILPY